MLLDKLPRFPDFHRLSALSVLETWLPYLVCRRWIFPHATTNRDRHVDALHSLAIAPLILLERKDHRQGIGIDWQSMPIGQNFAVSCLTIFAKQKPSDVERRTEDALNLRGKRNSYENQSCSTGKGGPRSFEFRFESRCASRFDYGG